MTERASIEDGRLTKDARKLLTTILHCFADEAFAEMPFMSKQQKRRGVVDLYERGFLEVIYDEGADQFGVRMCTPDRAPQLNGQPTFIKQAARDFSPAAEFSRQSLTGFDLKARSIAEAMDK
jgi:hypothetical protein